MKRRTTAGRRNQRKLEYWLSQLLHGQQIEKHHIIVQLTYHFII